jgi:circadian clock protein KaiC
MASQSNPPSTGGTRTLVNTGIEGLDHILGGGLPPNHIYLIEGSPGSGKTTVGLQFLLEGISRGEVGLYVSLSETKEEVAEIAENHGWDVSRLEIIESSVSEKILHPEEQSTIFHPSEMELSETTTRLLAEIERINPSRVVFDSLSELRLMAQSPLRYRQQIMGFKRYFIPRQRTVLMLDSRSAVDLPLQTISHGMIQLEQVPLEYGGDRRRMRVVKMRGREVSLGWHDFVIRTGGLIVYPRLKAVLGPGPAADEDGGLRSGIAELDALVGGGLPMGTSTLIMGPPGTGKSSIAFQYAIEAANRGERGIIFSFDESVRTSIQRSRGLGQDLEKHLRTDFIRIERMDPGRLSPGEFTARITQAVEPEDGPGVKVLVIDSLNGYVNAMPEERFLMIQLHELLSYVGRHDVATLIVMAQHGLIGLNPVTPVDTSHLADNVILLRFFEAAGRIRRAISAIKVRSGEHEDTIRELQIGPGGIHVGPPLLQFQGILTGEPQFLGDEDPLMKS